MMKEIKIFTEVTFYLYMFVSWIVNVFKLANCDFAEPYKEEFVHIIGAFIPGASMLTCWY